MTDPSLAAALEKADGTLDASLARLFELLRIPSISAQPAHAADCARAAEWLRAELSTLGFAAKVCPTPGHPMVVAHDAADDTDTRPHVLFYGHYDVQPTDPDTLWDAPAFDPYKKTLEDGRRVIVGRGTADDKGQLMTFLEACRAWRTVSGRLPVRVTVLIEGEEESGGANLLPFLKAHAEELRADIALICDTGMADVRTPGITTGLRGLVGEEIRITCATHDLHSGLYGNAARNPIELLCRALASVRDGQGRVTLPGFYDGVRVPDEATRAAWRRLYPDDSGLLAPVGLSVAAGEDGFSAIEQTWCRPSFEINGISGGYEGDGFKTVLPSTAMAKVSFRTVPGQNPQAIRDAFRAHVRALLPADATVSFASHGASTGFAVPEDGPFLPAALQALTDEWQVPAVTIGSGGSIPVVAEVEEALGMASLMIGFGQADDRMHSPNEKYDMQSFHKGIRSWIRVMAALAQARRPA